MESQYVLSLIYSSLYWYCCRCNFSGAIWENYLVVLPLLTSMDSRQFLALVEFESRKKKRAAKVASEYMEKFRDGIQKDEEALNKRLRDLGVASYVTSHVLMQSRNR
jgi:DNA-directed RNA polymerase subunit N (RpoN/RPB10)